MPTPGTGKPPGARGGRPDAPAAEVDARTAAPAFQPQRSLKPDSRGQDALPARRPGFAGHLLPPVGGEASNNASPFRIDWKGPLGKKIPRLRSSEWAHGARFLQTPGSDCHILMQVFAKEREGSGL